VENEKGLEEEIRKLQQQQETERKEQESQNAHSESIHLKKSVRTEHLFARTWNVLAVS